MSLYKTFSLSLIVPITCAMLVLPCARCSVPAQTICLIAMTAGIPRQTSLEAGRPGGRGCSLIDMYLEGACRQAALPCAPRLTLGWASTDALHWACRIQAAQCECDRRCISLQLIRVGPASGLNQVDSGHVPPPAPLHLSGPNAMASSRRSPARRSNGRFPLPSLRSG
jgi:hypothetical protein